MLEPQVVEHPPMWPNTCIATGTQTGPFVDFHRELPGGLHVYLSADAIKTGARLLGFTKGDRMTELQGADKHLREARHEIERLAVTVDAVESKLHAEAEKVVELEAELAQVKARNTQLEDSITKDAKDRLALVTGHVE